MAGRKRFAGLRIGHGPAALAYAVMGAAGADARAVSGGVGRISAASSAIVPPGTKPADDASLIRPTRYTRSFVARMVCRTILAPNQWVSLRSPILRAYDSA